MAIRLAVVLNKGGYYYKKKYMFTNGLRKN